MLYGIDGCIQTLNASIRILMTYLFSSYILLLVAFNATVEYRDPTKHQELDFRYCTPSCNES